MKCAWTLLVFLVSTWAVTVSPASVGEQIAEDFHKWAAEEAILDKIKEFIERGRPTRLDISPIVAILYLLHEDPLCPSESIASKLIAAFVNNPNPETRQRFLERVRYFKKFSQTPIWFHDYMVTQSGRTPTEWKDEFRQFILSRRDVTIDEMEMRFFSLAGRLWFIFCVERLSHDPSACQLTSGTTPPRWVLSITNQKTMYRTLTLRLIVSLSRRKYPNTTERIEQVWEHGVDEPLIASRKRPCEIQVDEGDIFIERENDNLSPMAEILILSPFDHPPAEAKRMKSPIDSPSTPAPTTTITPEIEIRSEPHRRRGRPRKISPN